MNIRKNLKPYFLVLPAFLILIGILYPFGLGVYYSFTDITFVDPTPDFIGITNYMNMFTSPGFWRSLSINLQYAFGSTSIALIVGFIVAYYLDKHTITWMRSILILPFMVPPMTAALIWRTMLRSGNAGILNHLLSFINIGPYSYLSSNVLALPSVILIDI